MAKEPSYCLKLAILGEKQVGKTSLVTRYTLDDFNPIYLHTKGGDITERIFRLQGKLVHITLIDSAGHRYVRSLIKTLYRDVHGILLVYDVTRKATFEALDSWLEEINMVNTSKPFIMLVGNKMDLRGYSAVSSDEARTYALRHDLNHIECSAKSGLNVVKAFDNLLQSTVTEKLPSDSNSNIKLLRENSKVGKRKYCCGL